MKNNILFNKNEEKTITFTKILSSSNHQSFSINAAYGPFNIQLKLLKLYFKEKLINRNSIGQGSFSKVLKSSYEGKEFAIKFIGY